MVDRRDRYARLLEQRAQLCEAAVAFEVARVNGCAEILADDGGKRIGTLEEATEQLHKAASAYVIELGVFDAAESKEGA